MPHDGDLLESCLVLLYETVDGLLGGLEALHGLLCVQLLEAQVTHQLLQETKATQEKSSERGNRSPLNQVQT